MIRLGVAEKMPTTPAPEILLHQVLGGSSTPTPASDVIVATVKDAIGSAADVVKAVVVRTVRTPTSRRQLSSSARTPRQARQRPARPTGPVGRELQEKRFMKIISLAEVL